LKIGAMLAALGAVAYYQYKAWRKLPPWKRG
jgi:hypothetical protein